MNPLRLQRHSQILFFSFLLKNPNLGIYFGCPYDSDPKEYFGKHYAKSNPNRNEAIKNCLENVLKSLPSRKDSTDRCERRDLWKYFIKYVEGQSNLTEGEKAEGQSKLTESQSKLTESQSKLNADEKNAILDHLVEIIPNYKSKVYIFFGKYLGIPGKGKDILLDTFKYFAEEYNTEENTSQSLEEAFKWLTVRATTFSYNKDFTDDKMPNQYIGMNRFFELIQKYCQIKPVDFKKEDFEIYYEYVEQFKIEGDCITRDTFPGLKDEKTSVELLEKYVDYIIGFRPWELQKKALEISKSECLGLFFTYFDNWINGFKNRVMYPPEST